MDTGKMNMMLQQLFGMDMEDKLFIVEKIITSSSKNKEKQLQDLVRKRLKKNQY